MGYLAAKEEKDLKQSLHIIKNKIFLFIGDQQK